MTHVGCISKMHSSDIRRARYNPAAKRRMETGQEAKGAGTLPAVPTGVQRGGSTMTSASIILVSGFWLGAWAWDEVAATLRADGHDVTALTLPGLESADAVVLAADHGRPDSTGLGLDDRLHPACVDSTHRTGTSDRS